MRCFMQPYQVFKHIVLAKFLEILEQQNRLQELRKDAAFLEQMHRIDSINSENIEDIYEYFASDYNDELLDARNEVLSGQVDTGISCAGSRHYDTKSVAAMSPYGKWIGWTVFSGGGKHGEPFGETLDNLNCYHLEVDYKVETVQILQFRLPEENTTKEENNGN